MKITRLSLTNFKSFKETQTINFGKVTLMLGPNSVGKSSALLALFYLHHILQYGNCDPLRMASLGNRYIGGFRKLVYGENLTKKIKIKIEYEMPTTPLYKHLVLSEDAPKHIEEHLKNRFSPIGEDAWYESIINELRSMVIKPSQCFLSSHMSIELEIAWCFVTEKAFVSSCVIEGDGTTLVELRCDGGDRKSICVALNYLDDRVNGGSSRVSPQHFGENHWIGHALSEGSDVHRDALGQYLLASYDFDDSMVDQWLNDDTSKHCLAQNVQLARDEYSNLPKSNPRWDDPDWHKVWCQLDENTKANIVADIPTSEDAFVNEFHKSLVELYEIDIGQSEYPKIAVENYSGQCNYRHVAFEFESPAGALPLGGIDLLDGLDARMLVRIGDVLENIMASPLRNLLFYLRESVCIGPLRVIPDQTYEKNLYPTQGDWYDGRAAWDVLDHSPYEEINKWMSNEEKLNLGYELEPVEITETRHVTGTSESSSLDLQKDVFLKRRELLLRKVGDPSFVRFYPNQVGIGISQIMPLIVAVHSKQKGFVAIEQPELHVHPRVQVAIGDLLTQVENAPVTIVETHSEHLMLRFVTRVRQTASNNLPEGLMGVAPDDVKINYLEPSGLGVKVSNIKIGLDGEFENYWPDGFFDERRKEFMSD